MLYQSILNAKLTGRKKLGSKRCTSNRDDRKLENTVKQSPFKHLGELHKEWTKTKSSDRGHAVSKHYLLANNFRGGLWNSGTSRLCNMLKMSLDQTVKRTPYIILQLSRAHNVSNHPSQNESRVIKHYLRCFIFSSCFEIRKALQHNPH